MRIFVVAAAACALAASTFPGALAADARVPSSVARPGDAGARAHTNVEVGKNLRGNSEPPPAGFYAPKAK